MEEIERKAVDFEKTSKKSGIFGKNVKIWKYSIKMEFLSLQKKPNSIKMEDLAIFGI